MEEAPCKNCLVLPICKNKYKDFVLEKLYKECSLLRTYILQNHGMPVSGIFSNTLDKEKLISRINNVKKYIPDSTSWIINAKEKQINRFVRLRTNK